MLGALAELEGAKEQLFAVYKSAVIGRQELGQGWDFAQVRPVICLVQVRDDPINEATVQGFLRRHRLVKQENLVGLPRAEMLDKGVR